MKVRGSNAISRRLAPVAVAAACCCLAVSTALAQNTYQDLEGRFALDLPPQWNLASEQFNKLFQFQAEGAPQILLFCEFDVEGRDSAFAIAVNMVRDATAPPPRGSVYDMEVNGNSARWAEYIHVLEGQELTVFLGGVALEGTGVGIAYWTIMNQGQKDSYGESLKRAFHTVRVPGAPVIGASASVAVDIDYTQPLAAAAPATASTFEHELLTLTVPAGWSAQPGKGAIIAVLERDGVGSLRAMGLEKEKFGRDREEILKALVEGMQSTAPSMQSVKGPYEVATDVGETVLVREFAGVVTVEGQDIPWMFLVASAKDKERGLGFMGSFKRDARAEAAEQMLGIIRSLAGGVDR